MLCVAFASLTGCPAQSARQFSTIAEELEDLLGSDPALPCRCFSICFMPVEVKLVCPAEELRHISAAFQASDCLSTGSMITGAPDHPTTKLNVHNRLLLFIVK